MQASRTKALKIHAIAFGITTDSNKYQFWFMDSFSVIEYDDKESGDDADDGENRAVSD